MPVGRVKFFVASKGYGFITPVDGSIDVFVHISAIEQAGLTSLQERQMVSYEMVTDRRTGKLKADKIRVV